MATVGTFNIALALSASRFTSGLSNAERQWNRFVRSIQRQSKTLPQSIQSVLPASLAFGRNIVKVGAIAGAALSGIGIAGIKLAADFEQTRIAFNTLLGSAEKANKFLGDLVEFAAHTPFQFPGLAQASRQLLAYGFAAEEVLPTLRAIGDAVSALGGGQAEIQRAVLAMGQIRAKGKLAGEEMRQLTELGIPAWEMLAKSIGVSIPEAMKLVEKRAISASKGISAILQGINQRFAGAMDVQSKTLLGRLSTLRDNIEIILRGFGEDIIRVFGLKDAINSLTQAVSHFAAAVAEYGFLGALSRAFPPWLQDVIVGIAGAIIGALVPAIVAWLIPALRKLSISLWATLRPLTPWMAIGAAVALTARLIIRSWGHLGDVARQVWGGISAVVLYAASLVVRGAGMIDYALSLFIPGLRGVAQAVFDLADSLKASAAQSLAVARTATQAAQSTQAAASSAQKTAKTAQQATQAQEGLGDAMKKAAKSAQDNLQSFDEVHQLQKEMASTSPDLAQSAIPDITIPQVPEPAGGISASLSELGDSFGGLADKVSTAWTRISQAMEPVNKAIQWVKDNWPTIGPIIENIASLLAISLVPALVKVGVEAAIAGGKMVIAWMESAAQAVASVAAQAAQIAIAVAKWIWLGVTATARGAEVAAAWIAAQGPVAWVVASIAAAAVAIVMHWDEIKAGMQRVWNWASTQVGPVWNGVRSVIEGAWIALQGTASNTWSAIKFAIQGVWDWASSGVGTVWDGVRTVTEGAWNVLAEVAKIIWDSIQSSIASVWNWASTQAGIVWASVRDVITPVWEALKQAAGTSWGNIKMSIQAVWDWASTQAGVIWGTVRDTVSGAWDALKSSADRVWTPMREIITEAWNKLDTWASELWNGIEQSVTSVWNSLKTTAQDKWPGIRDSITNGWSTVKTTVTNAVDGIESAINTMASNVRKWVQDMKDKIIGWFNKMENRITSAAQSIKDAVTGPFRSLYNILVGHSIVPDLVNQVTAWFNKMTQNTTAATVQMGANITGAFGATYGAAIGQTLSFVDTMGTLTQQLSTYMQSAFQQAFDRILKGGMSFGEAMQSIFGAIGDAIYNTLVQQLSQAASRSLTTLGQWALGAISKAAAAVSAFIQQAYAALLAFFAWMGPFAPAAAGGVIAAGIAGMVALARQAAASIVGLAQGGIVTGPTLAMMGEGGRREAVIPLERDNVIADSVGQAVYEAMLTAIRVGQATGQQSSGDREIVLRIDGTTFARAVLPPIIREGQRQGLQLVVRPQGV